MHASKPAQPYWNPYVAGVGLGLVLLASFVVMGRGLGASGAVASTITAGLDAVAPSHVANNPAFAEYLKEGTSPLMDWLVFEVLGVFVGGFLSGTLAHRVKTTVEHGPRITSNKRLMFAFVGGVLMGVGAKLARGCTSGQALTGGALLNAGAWLTMIMIFVGAYALAYFLRWQWR
jgi:hypothetical protein